MDLKPEFLEDKFTLDMSEFEKMTQAAKTFADLQKDMMARVLDQVKEQERKAMEHWSACAQVPVSDLMSKIRPSTELVASTESGAPAILLRTRPVEW